MSVGGRPEQQTFIDFLKFYTIPLQIQISAEVPTKGIALAIMYHKKRPSKTHHKSRTCKAINVHMHAEGGHSLTPSWRELQTYDLAKGFCWIIIEKLPPPCFFSTLQPTYSYKVLMKRKINPYQVSDP